MHNVQIMKLQTLFLFLLISFIHIRLLFRCQSRNLTHADKDKTKLCKYLLGTSASVSFLEYIGGSSGNSSFVILHLMVALFIAAVKWIQNLNSRVTVQFAAVSVMDLKLGSYVWNSLFPCRSIWTSILPSGLPTSPVHECKLSGLMISRPAICSECSLMSTGALGLAVKSTFFMQHYLNQCIQQEQSIVLVSQV